MATAKKTTRKEVKVKPAAKTVKKAVLKKVTEKPAAKAIAKSKAAEKATEVKEVSLTVTVLDTDGKVAGKVTLPKEVFGAKANPQLVAQAVRVYLVNQRRGTVSTKTRGEVDGSTRKIYRQKGTGRARHGGIRAPIFVKGGIAHGPKPKDYSLSFPKKMKQVAFASALSGKVKEGGIKVVTGIDKLEKKTKEFAKAFENWGFSKKNRKTIFVLPKDMQDLYRAMRNLKGITVTTADRLNTYDVLKHKAVVLMKEAVEVFSKEHKSEK
jgi:large subunit ribosomal protein L4